MATNEAAPGLSAQSIADIALKEGFCTADQIAQGRERWRASGSKRDKDLAQILIDMGYLTQQQARACERALHGGTVIAGFEILEKVGQGGMGAVFRARQVSMDRIVALKILPPKLAQDPSFKKRFLNEARACARLSHKNIINGIDCGEASGYTYFAMEFVEGRTINQILKEKGKFEPTAALAIIRQMAEALGYAKRQGLVHRDVKPDNIMLTPNGTAKLCDLGLAKRIENETDSSLTQAGQAVGTPHYIPPEQARGESVDFNSDIYSLGATFYHMVTGKTPFDAPTSAAVMALHITEEVKSPCDLMPTLPIGYGQVISKMMAKAKDDRYPSPEGLVADLDALENGKAPVAASFKAKSSCQMPHLSAAAAKGSLRGRTTGPQSPIGERSAPAIRPARSVAKSNQNGIWMAVGALGLIAVIAVVVVNGNGKPAAPAAPARPTNPVNVAQAEPAPAKAPAPVEAPKAVETAKAPERQPDAPPKVKAPVREPEEGPKAPVEPPAAIQKDVVIAEPKRAVQTPVVDEAAAMRELLTFEASFIAALRKGEGNKAVDMLKIAEQSPALKTPQSSVAQDRVALGWMGDIDQAFHKGIAKLGDVDDFDLAKQQGSVHVGKNAPFQFVSATKTSISVSSKDGMSTDVQIATLRRSTLVKIAMFGLSDDATGHVRRALINVLEMDSAAGSPLAAETQTSIDRAQKSGAPAGDVAYLRRIFMAVSDPALPGLPPKEALKQIDAHQQEASGDSWWTLADAENEAARKDALRQRAVFWYTLALPGLTGASKASVEKRIGIAKPEVVIKLDAAVLEGLHWLAKNQEQDGHWDSQKNQATMKTDVACTGFALTAFIKSGSSENGGPFQENVKRAVAWLKSKQRDNGSITDRTDPGLDHTSSYENAIAGTALIQAAGASRIPETLAAAQKVVDYSTKEHQSDAGGFRYKAKDPGCISVSGWYFQQLKAAKVVGLKVPDSSIEAALKFLDSDCLHEGPLTVYKYMPDQKPQINPRHQMIGATVRMMFGAKPEEAMSTIEFGIIRGGLPEWAPTGGTKSDLYYWHYGTLAMSMIGGDVAKRWDDALRNALLPYQLHEGNDAGSWPIAGDYANNWGRVGQTALACSCLIMATK